MPVTKCSTFGYFWHTPLYCFNMLQHDIKQSVATTHLHWTAFVFLCHASCISVLLYAKLAHRSDSFHGHMLHQTRRGRNEEHPIVNEQGQRMKKTLKNYAALHSLYRPFTHQFLSRSIPKKMIKNETSKTVQSCKNCCKKTGPLEKHLYYILLYINSV